MDAPPPRLDDLIAHVRSAQPGGDPLAHLRAAVQTAGHITEVADHLIGYFVDQARGAGASWTDIGESLGVTKQAAQKRFVPRGDEDASPGSAFWSRFTEGARLAVVRAEQAARDARHDTVGTEHLVIALAAAPDTLACRALAAQDVTHEALATAARAALGPPAAAVPEHIPFSSQLKKLREQTFREALRLGHNYVGTEHMLLALLAAGDTPGGRVLTELGVDRDAAQAWVVATVEELRRQRHDGA